VFDAFLVVECLVLVVEREFLDIRTGDERLQRRCRTGIYSA
jgi:hypothetical protein